MYFFIQIPRDNTKYLVYICKRLLNKSYQAYWIVPKPRLLPRPKASKIKHTYLMIEKAVLEKIALLSRLLLSPIKLEQYQIQISEVVEYNVRLLHKLGLAEKKNNTGTLTLGQEDLPRPSLAQSDAIGNAAEIENGFVVVPKVLE